MQKYVAAFILQTFVLLLSRAVSVLDIQLRVVVHCGNSSHIQMRQRVNLSVSNEPPQCPGQG